MYVYTIINVKQFENQLQRPHRSTHEHKTKQTVDLLLSSPPPATTPSASERFFLGGGKRRFGLAIIKVTGREGSSGSAGASLDRGGGSLKDSMTESQRKRILSVYYVR
jgi:hypothetical protein